MCRRLAHGVFDDDSPLLHGQAASWDCGIAGAAGSRADSDRGGMVAKRGAGDLNDHAVPGNMARLESFVTVTVRHRQKTLLHRSQRTGCQGFDVSIPAPRRPLETQTPDRAPTRMSASTPNTRSKRCTVVPQARIRRGPPKRAVPTAATRKAQPSATAGLFLSSSVLAAQRSGPVG